MISRYIEQANFEDTGFSYTLSLISGKYKMVILYCLMEFEPVRFNALRRYLKKVSDKTLSQNLRELEQDGLIHKTIYPQIPPKVEYTLTARGRSLMKVLDELFTLTEQDQLGGQALRFLGLIPEDPAKKPETGETEEGAAEGGPGLETVKN